MTSGTSPALARMFRRAALPLAWYYAVTLGLPLANGAAQSGAAFVNHALFVVAVPPLLIVLLCTIHESAQVFARRCRARRQRQRHAAMTSESEPNECRPESYCVNDRAAALQRLPHGYLDPPAPAE
jgi:hypothetical protein